MGRTVPTVRQSMEILATRMQKMSQIMNAGDVETLNRVLLKGRMHAHEVSYAGIESDYGFLISILIEMEKELKRLREELNNE